MTLSEYIDSVLSGGRAHATHFRRDGFAGIGAGASNDTAKFGQRSARVNSFEYNYGVGMGIATDPALTVHSSVMASQEASPYYAIPKYLVIINIV